MEPSDYKAKYKLLFDKLFQNKFEIRVDQTENLLKYLDGSHDKCVAKILETPFFANLLLDVLKNYEHASISVKIFIAKLLRIVLSNEVFFNRFRQMQGFDLLSFTLQSKELRRAELTCPTPDASTELYQAIMQLSIAICSHYSGVKYVVESKIYQRILTTHTNLRPTAAAAASYESIAKLIWKLNEYEEEAALLEVLQYVVNPLSVLTFKEDDFMANSVSFVDALVYILGEVEHLLVPNTVVPMLTLVFSIETKLVTALEATRDPILARLLAEASFRYSYASSRQLALNCPDSETRVNQEFHNTFVKILTTLIQKRSYETVLEFLSQCHIFWHRVELIGQPIEFEKFSKKYVLKNQFLVSLLVPLYLKQDKKTLVSNPLVEAAREIFHCDLAITFTPDMISVVYEIRDLIIESTGNDLGAACAFALRELLRLKRLLSRQQACEVFRTLFYSLSEFVLSDGCDLLLLADPLGAPGDERYLALTLDGIAMLLDEHQINWHESLEIVQLQAALINLIKQNTLPVKLLVQTVDLITTSVRKLLSPELALLMESRRGGSLREVAGAARALLARPEPDARGAALRLAHSFVEVAYVKFMPLRAVISAHALVTRAAGCALRDAAARAQAAALRCLAAAARCEDLWTELLEHCSNLYKQLVSIMQCNPEGEVRKEAASALSHVYTYRRVTAAFTRHLCQAMAGAATEDPHWPVRLAALNFWKQLISKHFFDRGVIDGKFPSVTFCKEKRKIIVLNDKTIHKQIEISMGHLSTTGCLAVLLKCMDCNNNREVIEKTYQLTRKLVDGLDQYNYSGIRPSESQAIVGTVDIDQSTSQSANTMQLDGDDVMMDILECLGSDSSGSECMSEIEIIPPITFLERFREVEKKWPPKVDLGTLIDEILSAPSAVIENSPWATELCPGENSEKTNYPRHETKLDRFSP